MNKSELIKWFISTKSKVPYRLSVFNQYWDIIDRYGAKQVYNAIQVLSMEKTKVFNAKDLLILLILEDGVGEFMTAKVPNKLPNTMELACRRTVFL